jgi:hypothetical protein
LFRQLAAITNIAQIGFGLVGLSYFLFEDHIFSLLGGAVSVILCSWLSTPPSNERDRPPLQVPTTVPVSPLGWDNAEAKKLLLPAFVICLGKAGCGWLWPYSTPMVLA